jgi:2-aminoadipate transaminase
LRYEGDEIVSLKSFDPENERVIYAGTFSKPCSPGLKTGYSIMPKELIEPLIRLKGNHDFGSCNLSQYVIHELLHSGVYYSHVEYLRTVYRPKRDMMLETLKEAFHTHPEVRWTLPKGGMFTWFSLPPGYSTGAESPFFKAAISEGVLYIPGEYGFVGENVTPQKNHARVAFGDAPIEMIREGILRMGRAFDRVKSLEGPERLSR